MGLQSEHTESGKSLTCPGCKQALIAPPAPPRPIGGWLAAYGVLQILALCMYVMTFALAPLAILLTPFMAPTIILLYGFFKQRKWFVPCALYAQVFNFLMAASVFISESQIVEPAIGWIRLLTIWALSLTCLLYFWRSQRVKETFTT